MLIFSRKKDETFMVGDDVEITITEISPNHVKVGIKAPRHIPVHRLEVYEAIKAAKENTKEDVKKVAS